MEGMDSHGPRHSQIDIFRGVQVAASQSRLRLADRRESLDTRETSAPTAAVAAGAAAAERGLKRIQALAAHLGRHGAVHVLRAV